MNKKEWLELGRSLEDRLYNYECMMKCLESGFILSMEKLGVCQCHLSPNAALEINIYKNFRTKRVVISKDAFEDSAKSMGNAIIDLMQDADWLPETDSNR